MAELRTYKDFADNSYAYFMFAYDNGQIFNEMGAMAQSICERYLKHLIAEYARTGLLCISREEAELLRRYARTMGEWGK